LLRLSISIYELLYRVIAELKISEDCNRVCTSDNASNMLAAIPALTQEVNTGLGCVDHLLHLVVNKALSINADIAAAVDSFKNLASKTHKSDLHNQRMRKECQKVSKDESREGAGNKY
jgi:hypothetical protein